MSKIRRRRCGECRSIQFHLYSSRRASWLWRVRSNSPIRIRFPLSLVRIHFRHPSLRLPPNQVPNLTHLRHVRLFRRSAVRLWVDEQQRQISIRPQKECQMASNTPDLMMEVLSDGGVEVIFGLPSDGINALMEATST